MNPIAFATRASIVANVDPSNRIDFFGVLSAIDVCEYGFLETTQPRKYFYHTVYTDQNCRLTKVMFRFEDW